MKSLMIVMFCLIVLGATVAGIFRMEKGLSPFNALRFPAFRFVSCVQEKPIKAKNARAQNARIILGV
jgi:hypothetical protein